MAWIKLDDNIGDHPKFLAAGFAASWLYVCGVGYCRKYLTDGLIPRAALPRIGGQDWEALAATLIRVGLWHEHEDGYLVHDYLEMNESRAVVKERLAQDAARKRNGRGNEHPGAVQPESVQTISTARGKRPVGIRTESGRTPPAPVRPEASRARPRPQPQPQPKPDTHTCCARASSKGATGGSPCRAKTAGSARGRSRGHAQHVVCGRKCVPTFLHEEFLASLGGDATTADARLRAWYQDTLAAIPDDQPIGDSPAKFWRAHFAAWQPSVVPVTPTPKERNEFRDYMRRVMYCPHTPPCEDAETCLGRWVRRRRGLPDVLPTEDRRKETA